MIIIGDSMASRMERYYKAEDGVKKRSQINKDLYRKIYDIGEYSNIEGIAEMTKNNEIDITKVKKMLKSREDYTNQKEYRKLLHKDTEEKEEGQAQEFLLNEEEKHYDIVDALKEAKSSSDNNKPYLKLDNTNYDLLKQIKIEAKKDDNPEELKEMINTITNTSMLNKLGDKELSMKLLDDLGDKTATRNLLKDTEKIQSETDLDDTKTNNTFFTSSMSFDSSDFDDGTYIKKKNIIPKIIIALLIILIIALLIFVVLKKK